MIASIPFLEFSESGRTVAAMRDWEALYRLGDTPWDHGSAAPPLGEVLERHGPRLWADGPVLVPGCGTGHDVRFIAEAGTPALGLDVAKTAVKRAAAIPCGGDASYEVGDFLNPAWRAGRVYSAIWEHTCFCAIGLDQRMAYAEAAAALLPADGIFAGVFYLIPQKAGEDDGGPPFGVSIGELDALFAPWFERIDGWTPQRAYAGREGREWVGIYRRLPQERIAGPPSAA